MCAEYQRESILGEHPVELTLGGREVRAEVVSVQETVAKNDAPLMYRILEG